MKSKDYANKALALFIKLNDARGISEVYSILIEIYNGIKDYRSSLEYSFMAYKNDLEHNFINLIPADLNNISTQYSLLNKPDSTLYYIRKAIYYNKKIDNQKALAINYRNLSKYFLNSDINRLDSAYYFGEKAYEINNKLGVKKDLPDIFLLKGDIAMAKKDTGAAIAFYRKVIDTTIFKKNLDLQAKINATEKLYNIKLSQKQYIAAIDYLKQNHILKDSFNSRYLVNLSSFFQLEKEKDLYKNNSVLLKEEALFNLYRKRFFILLAILLFALTLYIRACYRRKIKKDKKEKKFIEKKLEFKNREMTINAISQIKINKILKEISRDLKEMSNDVRSSKLKLKINKIIKTINKCTNETIMDEFALRYMEVNPDFKSNLLKQFPGLSPSEFKVCMFLKLNLSTKEISELMGVHPRTINNYRSKLRKKFGLPSNISLFSFLSKIE